MTSLTDDVVLAHYANTPNSQRDQLLRANNYRNKHHHSSNSAARNLPFRSSLHSMDFKVLRLTSSSSSHAFKALAVRMAFLAVPAQYLAMAWEALVRHQVMEWVTEVHHHQDKAFHHIHRQVTSVLINRCQLVHRISR